MFGKNSIKVIAWRCNMIVVPSGILNDLGCFPRSSDESTGRLYTRAQLLYHIGMLRTNDSSHDAHCVVHFYGMSSGIKRSTSEFLSILVSKQKNVDKSLKKFPILSGFAKYFEPLIIEEVKSRSFLVQF